MNQNEAKQSEVQHIEVELLGHRGEIEDIFARAADGLWHKEDSLHVWIRFDEAVEGILSFAVDLPLKPYGKTQLLNLVKAKGEKQLADIIERDRTGRKEREMKNLRESYANSVADRVKENIGRKQRAGWCCPDPQSLGCLSKLSKSNRSSHFITC